MGQRASKLIRDLAARQGADIAAFSEDFVLQSLDTVSAAAAVFQAR